MSKVFLIRFRVSPTENSIMPEGRIGAYVCCYSGAETFEDAMKQSVKALQEDGLSPEETLEPFEQMDSSQWHLHVNDNWPDQIDSLATQDEFDTAMAEDRIVYGPFAAFAPL